MMYYADMKAMGRTLPSAAENIEDDPLQVGHTRGFFSSELSVILGERNFTMGFFFQGMMISFFVVIV